MATSRKRSFLYTFFIFFVIVAMVIAVFALVAYRSIPPTANINDCFTTSMFQVELCPKKSSYVRYNQLPKHLVSSLIASEDASFYFHKGFDWDEIQDSLEKSMDAGRWVRGGSTITQQLAKNLYLTKEKSLIRKMKEFFISQEIEKKLTKTQIIEKYFNVVEFGKNIYGIRKASQHYFQKSPSELTPAEGAYLISLLPNPVKYSTSFHAKKELSRYNKSRVNRTLSLLLLQGKISQEDHDSESARVDYGLWTPAPTYEPESMTSDGIEEIPQDSSTDTSTEAPSLESDMENSSTF
jgi:monofunctional glycosyltransferase